MYNLVKGTDEQGNIHVSANAMVMIPIFLILSNAFRLSPEVRNMPMNLCNTLTAGFGFFGNNAIASI